MYVFSCIITHTYVGLTDDIEIHLLLVYIVLLFGAFVDINVYHIRIGVQMLILSPSNDLKFTLGFFPGFLFGEGGGIGTYNGNSIPMLYLRCS